MNNQATYDFNPRPGVDPGEKRQSAQVGSPRYDTDGREYFDTVYGGNARQYTGRVKNARARNW